jgi:hypothetical protein
VLAAIDSIASLLDVLLPIFRPLLQREVPDGPAKPPVMLSLTAFESVGHTWLAGRSTWDARGADHCTAYALSGALTDATRQLARDLGRAGIGWGPDLDALLTSLGRLLDRASENATDFIAFKDLVVTAAHLQHRELGVSKARAYLAAREAALAADANATVYDIAKLAEASFAATKDAAEAGRLLESARAQAKDHFALTHIGRLYAAMGNQARADELFSAAAAACANGDACIQFIDRLKGFALPAETLKKWYAECGTHLSKPADKLRWAEGIADALNDKAWATEVYGQLAGQFSGADTARFELSRRSRADLNFYGSVRRH